MNSDIEGGTPSAETDNPVQDRRQSAFLSPHSRDSESTVCAHCGRPPVKGPQLNATALTGVDWGVTGHTLFPTALRLSQAVDSKETSPAALPGITRELSRVMDELRRASGAGSDSPRSETEPTDRLKAGRDARLFRLVSGGSE